MGVCHGCGPFLIWSWAETKQNDLLRLQWPAPLRNVLITKKNRAPHINDSVVEFAKHITATYPNVSLILEPKAAHELGERLPFPVYTTGEDKSGQALHDKVDLACSLGGDGTILHTASLFSTTRNVPPVLSFSMGTLGFLGEWKFKEYKRAFREVYMSGASAGYGSALLEGEEPFHPDAKITEASGPSEATPHEKSTTPAGWSSIRGKSMGQHRGSRILLRNRLKVGIFGPDGKRVAGAMRDGSTSQNDVYAMNEVTMHRGATPHLTVIEISIGGRFLTEGVSDGIIVATPTGSTAYSLSSGGSIVHPLVPSLLMTPICPRSLSFRPLVLPANTPISLRLSEKNRADEVEVSIDGVRRSQGLRRGMEIRVWGEGIRSADGVWSGGVPSIVRGTNGGADVSGEDHWVGGLNSLLKFNYPLGEV
jgi:NADH kinase